MYPECIASFCCKYYYVDPHAINTIYVSKGEYIVVACSQEQNRTRQLLGKNGRNFVGSRVDTGSPLLIEGRTHKIREVYLILTNRTATARSTVHSIWWTWYFVSRCVREATSWYICFTIVKVKPSHRFNCCFFLWKVFNFLFACKVLFVFTSLDEWRYISRPDSWIFSDMEALLTFCYRTN